MSELFSDLPEAIENTVKLAKKCDVEISTLGKWFFPKFHLPEGSNVNDYLIKLTHEGLRGRLGKITKEVESRVKHELDIIIKKGYVPYFLIMADMVNWANEHGIITNTRGSAAGSLVSYAIGITTVNPLTYYLPFERFLNPFRPSPPDIDLDVSDDRREELIAYIVEKYGKGKVAQICTFGRMLARAAVRDTARVLGYPYATGDRISKLIPPPKQGFPVDIPKALSQTPQLKEFYDNDADAKRIMDLAHHVEGSARHVSVHAAGVVVAATRLTDFTPLQKEPSGEKIITQYEFHACEDVGLIKFDILGIRNLSILGAAVDIVEKTRDVRIDLLKIPLTDKKTFEMLGRGETMGTFQLGGSGMTRYLKELKPTRVEDLMAMVALFRPGPMAVIPEYIARKRNPKLIKYLDPRMEKFLKASYGLLVYQDDLLFCALDLAGYTWEEVDKFRKAVGKKIPAEMAAQKEKFTKGIVKNGQTQEFAETLWKLFEPFQSYGFNKAHAASYGMVAYQTAYMKANYPVEFMAALLTAESADKDKISMAINECRKMGIKVLPPDINESDIGFKIVEDKKSLGGRAIRFGLSAIKNVGVAAIDAILTERNKTKFKSFPDFLSRTDSRRVNKRVLESLIKVGAMSNFGKRAGLLASIDVLRSKVVKKNKNESQQGLFVDKDFVEELGTSGTSQITSQIPEFTEEELETLERQLLGFSITGKSTAELISPYLTSVTHKISELLQDTKDDQKVKLAGVIREIRIIVTKKTAQEMAFARIEDETGSINLVVFPKTFSQTRGAWTPNRPVLVGGRIDIRDEELSLIVDFVENESQKDQKQSGEVMIHIPASSNERSLANLKKLLIENPGEQAVILVFERQKAKIKTNLKISWNGRLARQISETLGEHLS